MYLIIGQQSRVPDRPNFSAAHQRTTAQGKTAQFPRFLSIVRVLAGALKPSYPARSWVFLWPNQAEKLGKSTAFSPREWLNGPDIVECGRALIYT